MRSALLWRGAQAADDILGCCGLVPVDKAENPLKRRTFDKIVARISSELAEATHDLDAGFSERLLHALDVDYEDLTANELSAMFVRARAALPVGAAYAPRVVAVVDAALEGIAVSARGAALSGQRGAGALSAGDAAVLEHLRDAQAFYIQHAISTRNARLEARIAKILDTAARRRLSRSEVRALLEEAVGAETVLREQASYLDVVAGDVVGQARVLGILSRYRDAGIQQYVWESVLDEVTSDVCRFMHGTRFTVADGLQTLERMASNVDAAKEVAPWVRVGRNVDGQKVLYTKSGDTRREIATVMRSGVGIKDDLGEYATSYDAQKLAAVGICLPPAHGNCRSTIVADV